MYVYSMDVYTVCMSILPMWQDTSAYMCRSACMCIHPPHTARKRGILCIYTQLQCVAVCCSVLQCIYTVYVYTVCMHIYLADVHIQVDVYTCYVLQHSVLTSILPTCISRWMYTHMYIHVCRRCARVWLPVCTCVVAGGPICGGICVCLGVCVYTYMHTYMHTCIHTYIHVYTNTCKHANMNTYISKYNLNEVHQQHDLIHLLMCISMAAYVCVCVCVCIHTYTQTYEQTNKHTNTNAVMHTHIHTHIHTHRHIHT